MTKISNAEKQFLTKTKSGITKQNNRLAIAIIGSRKHPLHIPDMIAKFVDSLPNNTTIVSGGAKGVDRFAQEFAQLYGLKTIIHYPDWDTYGKRAGFLRNQKIVNDADKVVAFWDGISAGTRHSINIALSLNKPVEIHLFSGQVFSPKTQSELQGYLTNIVYPEWDTM